MNRRPLAQRSKDFLRTRSDAKTAYRSTSTPGCVRIWADACFEGLAFEQVELAPGERRVRLQDDHAIVFVRSGRGIINSGGAEYQAQSGSGFLFCPDRLWTTCAASDALRYETLYISRHKLTMLAAQLELTSFQLARLGGVRVLNSETSEAVRKVWAVFEARSSLLERGNYFVASMGRYSLRPVDLLASLADLTGLSLANRGFYTRAFSGSVALPVVGHNYGGN